MTNSLQKQTLESAVSALRANPLFRMSLGGKELFHSNLWEWLFDDRFEMPNFRAFFGIPVGSSVRVLREKSNLDLLISWTGVDRKTGCLVLENKVKSLPVAKQLKRYAEKPTSEFRNALGCPKDAELSPVRFAVIAPELLLRECADEIEAGSANEKGRKWDTLSYEDLARAIEADCRKVEDRFLRELLRRYVDFLDRLHDVFDSIQIDDDSPFFPPEETIAQLREIRLHDVYEKAWFAILKNRMKPLLKPCPTTDELYEIAYTNAGARLDYAFTRDPEPSPDGKIFVLQLQRGKLCIGANPVPEGREKAFNAKIEEIFRRLDGKKASSRLRFGEPVVHEKKNKDGKTLLMHHFGNFRYRYVKIADASFRTVLEKANLALAEMEDFKEDVLDFLEGKGLKK